MKAKIFIAVLIVAVLAFIALSQIRRTAFESAADFPRAALVYVQIADLPALIRLWNESTLKEKYLASDNFDDFKNRHLGLKLASRWMELRDAAGFPFDLETLGNLTENRAALALYDIGKLEFVFIAPVSDSVFAASGFAQNQNKFEEQTLDDGTAIYRANVAADRGRQKQELIFTRAKGRLIVATSEKLLAQTLANINAKTAKNRLSHEPSFRALSEKTEPRAATVWVNQTALNEDYYFKRYWLMSDVAELKNIRAGMFDFSLEQGRIVERRKFLLAQAVNLPAVEPTKAAKSLACLPAEVPFYRLQTASAATIDEAVQNTLFDRRKVFGETENKVHRRSVDDFDDFGAAEYSRLGEKFDEAIDDSEDDQTINQTDKAEINFANLLWAGNPQIVLTFAEPKVLPSPLFVDFERTAVFYLDTPTRFNRTAFESAVAEGFLSKIAISTADANLIWETKNENGVSWREMNLPMLGQKACYAVRGNDLILSNNSDFMRTLNAVEENRKDETANSSFTELAVLNFEQREIAYDRVFARLAKKNAADDFFTGNVKSLLDSAAQVRKIEVKRNYFQNFLSEEVTVSLRKRVN